MVVASTATAVVLAACGADDGLFAPAGQATTVTTGSVGSTATTTAGSGTGTSTSSGGIGGTGTGSGQGGATATGVTTSANTSANTSTAATTSASSSSVSATAASSSSSSGGGPVCSPQQGDDNCLKCVKGNCCMALEACVADKPCSCMLDCLDKTNDVGGCTQKCTWGTVWNSLYLCASSACTYECN